MTPLTSQRLADKLKEEFVLMTGIECEAIFLEKGIDHRPSSLSSNQKGIYVFLNANFCFKVGKAGSKSQARWNSHHYNLDGTTPSTFPKSIIKDLKRFKHFFPNHKHNEIESLNAENMREWIQNNVSRMEFIISVNETDFALNFLEALIQFRLKPEYEGKNA